MFKNVKHSLLHFLGTEDDPVFRNIFRGSSIVLVARILNAILLLVINFIVARQYKSGMVGLLALISSSLAIASIFSNFGTVNSILRVIPEFIQKTGQSSAGELIKRYTKLVGLASPVVAIILIGAVLGWQVIFPDKPITGTMLILTALFLPFFSLSKLFTEAIRALQRTRLYAFAHLLPALSNLVLLLLLMFVAQDLTDLPLYAYFGSGMLVFFILWVIVNQNAPIMESSEIPAILPSLKRLQPSRFPWVSQLD